MNKESTGNLSRSISINLQKMFSSRRTPPRACGYACFVPRTKLAKDKIKTQTLLCKVCKTIRVCPYATIDYGDANLNVVYELGLLHSLGKVVAILKPTTIPSDLQGLEYLDHNGSTESLKLELGKWLRDNVSSINGEQLEEYLKELTIQKHGLQ